MLTPVRVFVARLRALFGRADEDRDFAEELRSHLEMLTEDHIGRGMPPEEAARQARAQYFDTLGIDVIRGRGFEIGDGDPGSANIVINQKMADRFFPHGDPIGQKLRFVARLDSAGAPPQPWYTIVGVVPTIQQGSEDDVFRSAAS